ncbi:unnamed protein product [Adineta steineri]|uniref:Uncharacterized protein n=1 Tax=Adineta steineri TaxID=433720 RepID=A0A820SJT2_9BILA|nr:unnamed protein product [Adineta steineri]
MTDEIPCRRLSICRQLSDVLKSKRKSYNESHSSTSKFSWNCTLSTIDSPINEQSNISFDDPKVNGRLIKQKSISYDDVVFLASEQNITTNQTKQYGAFFSYLKQIDCRIFLF